MIPIYVPTPAVQKGIFSLAGLLTNVNVRNLSKPGIHLAKNLAEWLSKAVTGNLSKLVIGTAPAGFSRPVREDEAGLPTVITSLNEAHLSVIEHLNERRSTVIPVSNEAHSGVIARGKGIKKGSISSATLLHATDGYQPFGSMPKRSNSLRPSVLSQLAKLIPDSAATASNCSLSSGVIRILNCGDCPSPFGLLSRFIIDRWSPIELISPLLGGHLIIVLPIKTMPRSGGTLTGHLTTTVIKSNEEAVLNHITPQQVRHSHTLSAGTELSSFIWIIAAVRRDCQSISVKIHHIDAKSEHEARQTLAREHVTFFAGRIRKGAAHA